MRVYTRRVGFVDAVNPDICRISYVTTGFVQGAESLSLDFGVNLDLARARFVDCAVTVRETFVTFVLLDVACGRKLIQDTSSVTR